MGISGADRARVFQEMQREKAETADNKPKDIPAGYKSISPCEWSEQGVPGVGESLA